MTDKLVEIKIEQVPNGYLVKIKRGWRWGSPAIARDGKEIVKIVSAVVGDLPAINVLGIDKIEMKNKTLKVEPNRT